MRHFLVLLISLSALLCSCSSTNSVVSDGPFVKRRYQPGWHIDLGRREARPTEARSPAVQEASPLAVRTVRIERQVRPELSAKVANELQEGPLRTAVGQPKRPLPENKILGNSDAAPMLLNGVPEVENGPRRWNRMAIVSGIFLALSLLVIALGGGSILGYLFTFAVLTGLIGLIMAIKHKERGKGIAIAAIIVPVGLLIAVIVALNAVW